MILYRRITSEELVNMVNNKDYRRYIRYGENTFKYEEGCKYKHFFIYASHMDNLHNNGMYAQYVIPNYLIHDYGFGYYSDVKTMRNDALRSYYMPLPEVRIKESDFSNEYLESVKPFINGYYTSNELLNNGNELYNEEKLGRFSLNPYESGYLDYSYADVYYELVYSLAKKNDMEMYKVVRILKNMDLNKEIKDYFYNNFKYFEKQTNKYLKQKKK